MPWALWLAACLRAALATLITCHLTGWRQEVSSEYVMLLCDCYLIVI